MQGWRIKGNAKSHVQLIYFGGNAQDVSDMVPYLKNIGVSACYTFNYRGYGLSEGAPSQDHFYSDSLDIFDHVDANNPGSQIVVMGYSLGTAVAGYVAKHRNVSSLLLFCPIHSVEKIARERFFAPRAAIKHPFHLHETAKNIKADTLLIIAENDIAVPNSHSQLTFSNLPCRKKLVASAGYDHNSIFQSKEIVELISKSF